MMPEALKEIPGYKAILKAVLRQQIQQLVEQLSEQTGEETVVLSANISEGTLSHLGSEYGKVFLQEEQNIKSKFLGFCLKRNLSRQSESPQEAVFKAMTEGVPLLKRKTSNSDGCVASSAKMPKLVDVDAGNIWHNQSNIMKCLPDLSRATSNYVQKLNQTVGQEVMKDSNNDVLRSFPTELTSSMAAESDPESSRHEKTDIDMSIVKIENQSESNEKENGKADPHLNKFGLSQNIPQFGYTDVWNKGLQAGGSNQELTNHSTGLWNSFNQGQNTNEWQDLNATNNMLPPRKEYKCDFCDKTFREKTNLRVHVRTHTGEKPFKCFLCGKEFAHSSNMKQHERGVHKLPPTVPQYKQQFYTGLSKMYEMAKQSDNSYNENQTQLYQNMQNYQPTNAESKSVSNSLDNEEEKEYLFKESQVVFPTNGVNGFVNRIKVEAEETNDSRDTSSLFMNGENSSNGSMTGANIIEKESNGVDLL